MTRLSDDLKLRETNVVWFDQVASDCDGLPVHMYSVVTPVAKVSQYFAENEAPIELEPGRRLVVMGAADGNLNHLWLDVDDPGPWMGADICLNTAQFRYLCAVGDDLHMKGSR